MDIEANKEQRRWRAEGTAKVLKIIDRDYGRLEVRLNFQGNIVLAFFNGAVAQKARQELDVGRLVSVRGRYWVDIVKDQQLLLVDQFEKLN